MDSFVVGSLTGWLFGSAVALASEEFPEVGYTCGAAVGITSGMAAYCICVGLQGSIDFEEEGVVQ